MTTPPDNLHQESPEAFPEQTPEDQNPSDQAPAEDPPAAHVSEPGADLSALADASPQDIADYLEALHFGDRHFAHLLDESGRLTIDQPCVSCGYNLRGQLAQSQCTECGASIATSLKSTKLSFASPAWLGTLRSGMNWLVIGTLCTIGLMLGSFAISIFTQFTAGGIAPASDLDPFGLTLLYQITGIAMSLMIIYATWLLTVPEPDSTLRAKWRTTTRWTIIPAYAIGIVLTPFNAILDPLDVANNASLIITVVCIYLGTMLMMSVGFPASLLYLRNLARRIPDKGLSKQTSIVFWGQIIAGGVMILGALVGLFVVMSSVNQPNPTIQSLISAMSIMGLLICPGILAGIIFMIWWVILMCIYRARFAQVHDAAKRNKRNDRDVPHNSPAT